VVNAHDLMVHTYGHFYFTTIHVELSDRLNVHKMHEITVTLETRILREFPGQCVVHVDPVDLHHPLFHHVSDALREVVVAEPRLVEYSDLKLWNRHGVEVGYVEISVDPALPREEYGPLARRVEAELAERFPEVQVQVRLKVDFAATPISA